MCPKQTRTTQQTQGKVDGKIPKKERIPSVFASKWHGKEHSMKRTACFGENAIPLTDATCKAEPRLSSSPKRCQHVYSEPRIHQNHHETNSDFLFRFFFFSFLNQRPKVNKKLSRIYIFFSFFLQDTHGIVSRNQKNLRLEFEKTEETEIRPPSRCTWEWRTFRSAYSSFLLIVYRHSARDGGIRKLKESGQEKRVALPLHRDPRVFSIQRSGKSGNELGTVRSGN